MKINNQILIIDDSSSTNGVNYKLAECAYSMGLMKQINVKRLSLFDYEMPLYSLNRQGKDGIPEFGTQLHSFFVEAGVIWFCLPEHNGSFSASFKNTIDWLSRIKSDKSPFRDKFFCLCSASPGSLGGSRGIFLAKMLINHIGGIVIPYSLSLPNADKAFDHKGKLISSLHQDMLDNTGDFIKARLL